MSSKNQANYARMSMIFGIVAWSILILGSVISSNMTPQSSMSLTFHELPILLNSISQLLGFAFGLTALVIGIIALAKKRGEIGFSITGIILGSLFIIIIPIIIF